MNLSKIYGIIAIGILFDLASCKVPSIVETDSGRELPQRWNNITDSTNIAAIKWQEFFKDQDLVNLIDTALVNNQDLLMTLQEIEIARNEMGARQSELLPKVSAGAGIGIEKVGRYTSQGAGDASTEIKAGKEVPEWLPDYRFGAYANWEIDIWKKLRNAKKAAVSRYLATMEGRNFVITNLIAEIANTYYELLSLDNQLDIVRESIQLQKNALEVIRVQKQAARVNELAVKKFEAEVLNSQNLEYELLQQIKEAENRINFLLGQYPRPVTRNKVSFVNDEPKQVYAGIPSQLLTNRPDIKQAELELAAARLDVKVARSAFYPTLELSAGAGFQAFNPSYLVKFPESLLFNMAGELAGPLINKKAIKAEFASANARQLQAMYNYERIILNAFTEVSNELSNLSNLDSMYSLKTREVDTLIKSIDISNDLFKSARADYLEVLLTQRDALASRLELMETKKRQFNAVTNIYRELGGGWK